MKFSVPLPSLVLSLLFCTLAGAQIDYNAPENIWRFAESLYGEKEYARAVNEYERFLFLRPEGAGTDSVYVRIGKAYRNMDQYDKAITAFKKIRTAASPEGMDSPCVQMALTYHMARNYTRVETALSECPPAALVDRRVMLLRGVTLLKQKYWQEADQFFRSQQAVAMEDTQLFASYRDVAVRGMTLDRKNYIAAGLLSIVVPGAGKFYTGRYVDGMYSLLSVGLTGWQAYDGFSKDGTRSVKGWIYGVLCGGLYIGNIYGSLVSVNIYNTNLENELLKTIDISLNVPLD